MIKSYRIQVWATGMSKERYDMTLDEAIIHCEEEAQHQVEKGCYMCSEEHLQLAEWLKELRDRRKQDE